MAGSARHRALDPFLHRLWTIAAEALFRLFPAWQGHLVEAAESSAASSPCGSICRTRRTRMAAGADKMDQALPRSYRRLARAPPAGETRGPQLRSLRRRRNLSDAADARGHRDYRSVGDQAFRFVLDE